MKHTGDDEDVTENHKKPLSLPLSYLKRTLQGFEISMSFTQVNVSNRSSLKVFSLPDVLIEIIMTF